MRKFLVTGSNGQLGQCLKQLESQIKGGSVELCFYDRSMLDITNQNEVNLIISSGNFDAVINCAAYTKVDAAEEDKFNAFNINSNGVRYLAEACKENDVFFIHISTDYVYGGIPYGLSTPFIAENEHINPLNIYGFTKLQGENEIRSIYGDTGRYIIIRTQWLYSEFGHNFVKTILNKLKSGEPLKVVNDQFGRPTNANDLAELILFFLTIDENKLMLNKPDSHIYNFSNEGSVITWYDFARKIAELGGYTEMIQKIGKITTEELNLPANRPRVNPMSMIKLKMLGYEPEDWVKSLKKTVEKLETQPD